MLRLVGFFVLVIVTHRVLSHLPVVNDVLAFLGFFSFWAVAILVSVVASWGGERLVRHRRLQRRIRDLGTVDTPHNRGKLGGLLLAAGRVRSAVPHLEAAFAGQPDVLDWALGLGKASAALGKPDQAGPYFARVVQIDAEFGYGEAFLGLAEAALALGRPEDALGALADHDRRHGPNPRSAYVRGASLRALGKKEDARAAFGEVFALRSELPAYQRKDFASLAWKAFFARLS